MNIQMNHNWIPCNKLDRYHCENCGEQITKAEVFDARGYDEIIWDCLNRLRPECSGEYHGNQSTNQ